MKKTLGLLAILALALASSGHPVQAQGSGGPFNVHCDFYQGDFYCYDKNNAEVYHVDGTNRALVVPLGSALTLNGAAVQNSVGAGTASGTGVTVSELGGGSVHRTILTLTNVSVTITDSSAGVGGLLVYTFPEGYIQVLGVTANMTSARGDTHVASGALVVEALGVVVPADDSALTSTEASFIASWAGTLTAGAGVYTKNAALIASPFDGHTTAIPMFLNVAMPHGGTGSDASTSMVFNGTITIVWAQTGDI
jgi:hypothetical protein